MENESVSRIERSLQSFLALAWTLGVPDIRVRLTWRITYTVFLGLIFLVANYASSHIRFGIVDDFGSKDARVYLTTEYVTFISFYVMITVWLTRGARVVREAILDLAKVDDAGKHVGLNITKYVNFRTMQVAMGLQLVLFFVMTFMHYNVIKGFKDTESLILTIIYYCSTFVLPTIQTAFFRILFSSIIHAIRFRFNRINDTLSDIGKSCDKNSINDLRIGFESFSHRRMLMVENFDVERLLAELEILDKTHKQLCDITVKLTATFSPCLVIISAGLLLKCMMYAAFCLLPTTADEEDYKRYVIAAAVLGIVSEILQCWMVVSSCDALSYEVY